MFSSENNLPEIKIDVKIQHGNMQIFLLSYELFTPMLPYRLELMLCGNYGIRLFLAYFHALTIRNGPYQHYQKGSKTKGNNDDYPGEIPLVKIALTAEFTFQSKLGYFYYQSFFYRSGKIRPEASGTGLRSPPFSILIHSSEEDQNGGILMKKINLRDYYSFYTSDCFINVPDEIAAVLNDSDRHEAAYRLRTYRHKAYYSLDRNEGIDHDILFVATSPQEIYERKISIEQLYAAISSLPNKQAKRIYAYYFLGMNKTAIAKEESVSKATVGRAIVRGLRNMETYLKKYSE